MRLDNKKISYRDVAGSCPAQLGKGLYSGCMQDLFCLEIVFRGGSRRYVDVSFKPDARYKVGPTQVKFVGFIIDYDCVIRFEKIAPGEDDLARALYSFYLSKFTRQNRLLGFLYSRIDDKKKSSSQGTYSFAGLTIMGTTLVLK
jgi:hypothetical protein